jgi:hypothetical protein
MELLGDFPDYDERDYEMLNKASEEEKNKSCLICCELNDPQAKFCSSCRAAFDSPTICGQCGKCMKRHHRFCSQCAAVNPSFSNLKRSHSDVN